MKVGNLPFECHILFTNLNVFFPFNFDLRSFYSILSPRAESLCGTLNMYEVLGIGSTTVAESAKINAAFSCARVSLFTCSISFKMHTPSPSFFKMTKDR